MDGLSFKVGDRAHDKHWDVTGTVKAIRTETYVLIKSDDGYTECSSKLENVEHVKLSAEDAWLEAALLIGREVQEQAFYLNRDDVYHSRSENILREIRHKVYQFLGGNGIQVTDEAKLRVRSLIERTQRRD